MRIEGSPESSSQGVLHLGRHTAEGLGISGLIVADPHDVFLDLHPNRFFFGFFGKKKSGELINQGLRGVGTGSTFGSRLVSNLSKHFDQLFDGGVHRLCDLDPDLAHILTGLKLVHGEHGCEFPVEPFRFFQKLEVFDAAFEVIATFVLDRFDVILYLRELEGCGEYIGCGIDQLVGFIDDAKVTRQQAALGNMVGPGLLGCQE